MKNHGPAEERGRDERYAPPAIEWEEEIDISVNLASACAKIFGDGEPRDSTPSS
jgi:hypothetical protein